MTPLSDGRNFFTLRAGSWEPTPAQGLSRAPFVSCPFISALVFSCSALASNYNFFAVFSEFTARDWPYK